MRELKSKHEKNDVEIGASGAQKLDPHFSQEYYSHWLYAALHLHLLVDPQNTVAAYAKKFRVSEELIERVLQFLLESSLISHKEKQWIVQKRDLNLPRNSFMSFVNHVSWRTKAIDQLNLRDSSNSYHFSSALTLSDNDYEWFKGELKKTLNHLRERVRETKNENLVGICLDFFRI